MRTYVLSFLSFLFLSFQTAYINQPVVYLFNDCDQEFEIESQTIYGSLVEILETEEKYSLIKLEDGTKGYVKNDSLIFSQKRKEENLRPTKSLCTHVYKVTDTSPYPPIVSLPYGTKLYLTKIEKNPERWIEVELLDGTKAFVQKGDIELNPRLFTKEEMIEFSKIFLGLPYTWGGNTSFGFDCSGFIQMLFKKIGISLPCNSSKQANSDLFKEITKEQLKPGDLIFFGKTKVIHVGLYLGNNQFINATVRDGGPKVCISDLDNTDYNYLFSKTLKRK